MPPRSGAAPVRRPRAMFRGSSIAALDHFSECAQVRRHSSNPGESKHARPYRLRRARLTPMFRRLRWYWAKKLFSSPPVRLGMGPRLSFEGHKARPEDLPPNARCYERLASFWDDCGGWHAPATRASSPPPNVTMAGLSGRCSTWPAGRGTWPAGWPPAAPASWDSTAARPCRGRPAAVPGPTTSGSSWETSGTSGSTRPSTR